MIACPGVGTVLCRPPRSATRVENGIDFSRGIAMTLPPGKPVAASTRPALELISLARLSPEVARQNLRALLLANPNYFGNVTGSSFKAVLHIQEDTTYERLGCFGYSPELKQLRATISINQTEGYSGNIRAQGSEEYVRFYLSSDGGTTWQDQGMTAVNVFDAPGPKPVEHAVADRKS